MKAPTVQITGAPTHPKTKSRVGTILVGREGKIR